MNLCIKGCGLFHLIRRWLYFKNDFEQPCKQFFSGNKYSDSGKKGPVILHGKIDGPYSLLLPYKRLLDGEGGKKLHKCQ